MESLILVAALPLLAVLERLPPVRFEPRALFRRYFRDDLLCLFTGAVAIGLGMRAVVGRTLGSVDASAALIAAIPSPLAVLAAIVVYDLGGWLTHWLLHRFEPLWEIHKVHHSSRALDWLAAFRAHFLEHALRHSISLVLVFGLGFPLAAIGIAAAVYGSWAAFVHSNLRPRLRFLEPLLVTPRLHRMHHVPATSEKNLGTIFSTWDRLAGRFHADVASTAGPLGVPGEIVAYPQTWGTFTLEPFRRICSRAFSFRSAPSARTHPPNRAPRRSRRASGPSAAA